jgi:hypothetical protein
MEADETLAAAARAAGLDVRGAALPAGRVVPAGWPDVVLLLDVLEHVDDDRATLAAAAEMLAPAGMLVVTVPAYDFTTAYLSYFNTLLRPAIALARAWKRRRGDDGHDLVRPPAPLNEALARVFSLEAAVVSRCPMPCGASLLLIGRRR